MSGEGEPLGAVLGRILERIPPDLAELLRMGYRPVYHKRVGRWYLQKKVGSKISQKLVPKEYDDQMSALKRLLSGREAEAVTKILQYHLKLRETAKQTSKPIIAKEIEDSAWFHNLLHDLGKYAYHRLVKFVDWDEDDIKDYKNAFDKLSEKLDHLMLYIEDVERLERVMDERDALEILLGVSMDVVNRLTTLVENYRYITNMILQYIPNEYKTRLLNHLIVQNALRTLPHAVGGEEG